jgi:phosphotransferase system enzyme I (PtsI)
MLEVPSAVMMADKLAKECDFFSIGTNDLVQYTLAVDRLDKGDSVTCSPMHPAIIRMIRWIVAQGNRYNVPVTVCGESAGDPRFTALLIGLGISELSVNATSLPIIKNAIRHTSLVKAVALAERALAMDTAVDIEHLLLQEYRKAVPEDTYYNC